MHAAYSAPMRLTIAAGAAVGAFIWATWPAIGAFFTADDFVQLAVGVPASAGDALRYFTTDWGGSDTGGTYYRPLVNLSLWLNRAITGLSPAALRITNLALHIAVACAVMLAARRRLALDAPAAFLAGCLFLLWPLHDQAILWISARTDLLCALFYLLAFVGLTADRWQRQLGGCVAFAAALASKEMAVTLLLVLPFWWWLVRRPATLAVGARPVLLALAVLAAYMPLRVHVLGRLGGDPAFLAFDMRIVDGAKQLLLWALLPLDLERVRSFARAQPLLIVPLYALALAVLVIAIRRLAHNRLAWFGLGWIVITMLPVIARANSWYAYIPSVGGSIVLAMLCSSGRRGRTVAAFATILIAALGLRSGAQQMAAAARLSELAVTAASRAGTELLIVNSPIVLNDRFLVVTDQSHFDAAARALALPRVTTALNYAYVESEDDARLSAAFEGDAIIARADVGRRTYLTLDGTDPARATYEVIERQRAQIAAIRIVPKATRRDSVVTFSGGRLVAPR